MGAEEKNLPNQLTRRYGFEEAATEVQARFLAGRHTAAKDAVPQELVRTVSPLGTENEIAAQLDEFARAGVIHAAAEPGGSADIKVDQVRRAIRPCC